MVKVMAGLKVTPFGPISKASTRECCGGACGGPDKGLAETKDWAAPAAFQTY